ncbi:ABC transporter permease [Ahrensia sp. R2A130]|uniref:ABC transporter permease n=1 Tax=Ahrensia sp. R2A130 TaxID=744979 RepID=UPI0001E0E8B1|nr:binding-protein-dependent transport systems inner membrane component [Ahrensia sp. R2A130]
MKHIINNLSGKGAIALVAIAVLLAVVTFNWIVVLAFLLFFGVPLALMQEQPAYTSRGEMAWAYTYTFMCAAIFVFLISPILVVIPLSFNAEPYFTFTEKMLAFDPAGYSMRWYDQMLALGMANPDNPDSAAWWSDMWNNSQWVNATKNSIIIGFFATLLATALGTLAALGLSRPEMPWRRTIMAFLISPMIVPLIITATGLFFFYSDVGLANSYIGIIMAHATLGIPFVIITVTATLVGFDHSLTRAAQSLGANDLTTFRQIILPLITPGVISGALFAFVTSFDEVVVVLFIAAFDQQTIPRQMWNGIREQISPTILAAATILVFFSIALLTTVELLRRRSERMRGLSPD